MTLDANQTFAFRDASRPLMEWLSKNAHPHHTVLVDSGRAELMEGVAAVVDGMEHTLEYRAKTGAGTYSGAMQDVINRQDTEIAALKGKLAATVNRAEKAEEDLRNGKTLGAMLKVLRELYLRSDELEAWVNNALEDRKACDAYKASVTAHLAATHAAGEFFRNVLKAQP